MTLEEIRKLRDERRKAVKSLKQANPQMSGCEIAKRLGVAQATIWKDMRALGIRTVIRLTEEQREARTERVRNYCAQNPDASVRETSRALGLSSSVVQKACPRPDGRLFLGSADARMQEVYNRLQADYVCTPVILAKRSKTNLVTARNWILRNHPECVVNARGIKAPQRQFERLKNGKIETIRACKKRFPRRWKTT